MPSRTYDKSLATGKHVYVAIEGGASATHQDTGGLEIDSVWREVEVEGLVATMDTDASR